MRTGEYKVVWWPLMEEWVVQEHCVGKFLWWKWDRWCNVQLEDVYGTCIDATFSKKENGEKWIADRHGHRQMSL